MNTHTRAPRFFCLFLSGVLAVGCTDSSPTTPDNRAPGTNDAGDQQCEMTVKQQPQAPAVRDLQTPIARVVANDIRSESEDKPISEKKSDERNPPVVGRPPVRTEVEEEKEVPPEKDPPIPAEYKPLNKDKTLFFEKTAAGKRRVHILAEVCQRDEMLEVFLCKANTKEHEAILRADVDARQIHAALLAAGAKFGSTVKFVPKYKPASGNPIKVSVTYYKDGKLLTKPAQYWIQNMRTKKEMAHEWVFAGSRFFKNPDDPDKPPYYCANNGEVISIANFADSMLDLPVQSSRELSELGFRTYTERIPPLKTKVIVTLEPAAAEKK